MVSAIVMWAGNGLRRNPSCELTVGAVGRTGRPAVARRGRPAVRERRPLPSTTGASASSARARGRRLLARATAVCAGTVLLAAGSARLEAQEYPKCFSQGSAASDERDSRVLAGKPKSIDFITPHITDSHDLDLPYFHSPFVCIVELPRWTPVHIGGLSIDLSPTKHVVWLLIASVLCLVTLLSAASFHRRRTADPGVAGGFSAGVEALVLYLRQTVVLPNVGPHGDAYTPYILTVFFFILFANLVGLIPYGSTATGNISVTLTMALISFVVIEVSGMRALGADYWKTIIYWNPELGIFMRIVMTAIMTVIEIFSKFTKPFALTIRLFANMTAGHIVLLALISLIFTFNSYFIAVIPVAMGVAVSLLEIFVAFLQAFIFALLTAVFIGQIRQAAH
jgi:F-type H+-transporting ATPase subunit a